MQRELVTIFSDDNKKSRGYVSMSVKKFIKHVQFVGYAFKNGNHKGCQIDKFQFPLKASMS